MKAGGGSSRLTSYITETARKVGLETREHGYGRRSKVFYNPEEWPRDFETALDDLDDLTIGVPSLGVIHQWLDARDGFPNFADRESKRYYVEDREVFARALHVALTLRHAPPPSVEHPSHCASVDLGMACDCGAYDGDA